MISQAGAARIRQALRPAVRVARRMLQGPPQVATSAYGVHLGADSHVVLSNAEAVVHGWVVDPPAMVDRLDLVAGRERRPIPSPLVRTSRPDLDELCRGLGMRSDAACGFTALVSGSRDWLRGRPLFIEARLADGACLRVRCPCAGHGARAAKRLLERCLAPDAPVDRHPLERIVVPVIDQLGAGGDAACEVTSFVLGPRPEAPVLSLLMLCPDDRRDLLECRIAALARTKAQSCSETILVLPARILSTGLRAVLVDLADLYDLPLRVVAIEGAAERINSALAGARHCRGDWLCVLGGGVIPEVAALDAMMAFATRRFEVGMISPRLVREDGSIHYAGTGFAHDPLFAGPPRIVHRLQGMPSALAQTDDPQSVAAAAGDCFLIARATYEALASPGRRYLTPGFDEIELGLRCLQAGLQNWYLGTAELYDLEEIGRDAAHGSPHPWFARADELRLAREWGVQQEPWTGLADAPVAFELPTPPGAEVRRLRDRSRGSTGE